MPKTSPFHRRSRTNRNPVTPDAIVTDHRAELCDKLRLFQEVFGIERGAQLDGRTETTGGSELS